MLSSMQGVSLTRGTGGREYYARRRQDLLAPALGSAQFGAAFNSPRHPPFSPCPFNPPGLFTLRGIFIVFVESEHPLPQIPAKCRENSSISKSYKLKACSRRFCSSGPVALRFPQGVAAPQEIW